MKDKNINQITLRMLSQDFITWGYTVLLLSIVVFLLYYFLNRVFYFYLYALVPVIVNLADYVRNRRKTNEKTELTKRINKVWSLFGVLSVIASISRYFFIFPLIPVVVILISIETIVTGYFTTLKMLIILGIVGVLIGIAFMTISLEYQPLLLGGAFAMISIAPGHILKEYYLSR